MFFRAITLNIIFYLPANYRISFSACRPARPCSPHFGEAQGMALSLTRLCLICFYISTWHLPSTNHRVLFPPPCVFPSPRRSPSSHPGTCCCPPAATHPHPCLCRHPPLGRPDADEPSKGGAWLSASCAGLQTLSQLLTPCAPAPVGLCTI